MTKVINRKTYRSHTAHLIVTLPSHFPKTDKKWHETRLYRNQRETYFLAGEGGSLSRWAKMTPRGTTPGEGIEPISRGQALAMRNMPVFRQIGLLGLGLHRRRPLADGTARSSCPSGDWQNNLNTWIIGIRQLNKSLPSHEVGLWCGSSPLVAGILDSGGIRMVL